MKNKYLNSKLQEESFQIAVNGERTNCQLAVLRRAWSTACRIYRWGDLL